MPSINLSDKQYQILAAAIKTAKFDFKAIVDEIGDTTLNKVYSSWNGHILRKLKAGSVEVAAAKGTTATATKKRKSSSDEGEARASKKGRKKSIPTGEEDGDESDAPVGKIGNRKMTRAGEAVGDDEGLIKADSDDEDLV